MLTAASILALFASPADGLAPTRRSPATVLVVEPPATLAISRAVLEEAVATYFADLNWSWVDHVPPVGADVRLWAARVALARPARFVVWWHLRGDSVLVSNVLDLEDPEAPVDRTAVRLRRRGGKSVARTSLLRLRSAIRSRVRGAVPELAAVPRPPADEHQPSPPQPMLESATGLELELRLRGDPAWTRSLIGGSIGVWDRRGSWDLGVGVGMDLPEPVEPPGAAATVRRFRAACRASYLLPWTAGSIAWLIHGHLGATVVAVGAHNDAGDDVLDIEPMPVVGLGVLAELAQWVQVGAWGDLHLIRTEVRVAGRLVYASGYGEVFFGIHLRAGY